MIKAVCSSDAPNRQEIEVEDWDVIIIGAGPAGSAAAITTSRLGFRVLLVDAKQFPRHKVCGGCLNRRSTGILRGLLGEQHELWRSAVPLNSLELQHAGRRFRFKTPTGFAVERARLDNSLVEAAVATGATFRAPVMAGLGAVEAGFRQVRLRTSNSTCLVRARLVILAGGLNIRRVTAEEALQHQTAPNSRVGLETVLEQFPAEYTAGTIRMVVGRTGYVGLTHVADGRLHVAAAIDKPELQDQSPHEVTARILREAGASELPHSDAVHWRGTLPLTSRARRVAASRALLIGDAAGYIEPFTGEGIRWALQSGTAVGEFAESACGSDAENVAQAWEAWYAAHIRREQRLCRCLSWGLKRPAARWLAHQVLRTSPGVAQRMISHVNEEHNL